MFFALTTLAIALTTLAIALVGAVRATPVSSDTALTPAAKGVNAPIGVPVVDLKLGSVSDHGNVTLAGKNTLHSNTGDDVDATLLLCTQAGCSGCSTYYLSILPHNTCLTPGFNFLSVMISQASNAGLPFGVSTGPAGCSTWAQVPQVNTCYNAVNYVGWDFELTP